MHVLYTYTYIYIYIYIYIIYKCEHNFLKNKFKQTNLLEGLIDICEHSSRSG